MASKNIPWTWYAACTALALSAIAVAMVPQGATNEGLRLASRFTAQASFAIFLLAFSASAMAGISRHPAIQWLAVNRRHVGLGFAWAHFIHLCVFVTYHVTSGISPTPATLIGGGLGYVFVAALASTSNNWSQRKLGHNWRRLHRAGVYYLWFIYTFTYFGAITKPDRSLSGIVGMPLCLSVIVLRFAAPRLRARRLALSI